MWTVPNHSSEFIQMVFVVSAICGSTADTLISASHTLPSHITSQSWLHWEWITVRTMPYRWCSNFSMFQLSDRLRNWAVTVRQWTCNMSYIAMYWMNWPVSAATSVRWVYIIKLECIIPWEEIKHKLTACFIRLVY